MLHAFCKTAPTKVLLAGADLLLTMSFRGGLGGLKPNLGGPKLVEAHHSDSPHHLLARHPTCWMIHKGDSQKADDAAVPVHLWLRAFAWGYGDPSCLAHHQVALGLLGGSAGSLANSKPPSAFGVAGVHGRVMQVCSPVLEEEGGAGVSQVATGQPALAS